MELLTQFVEVTVGGNQSVAGVQPGANNARMDAYKIIYRRGAETRTGYRSFVHGRGDHEHS